jgi:hypothetical protein
MCGVYCCGLSCGRYAIQHGMGHAEMGQTRDAVLRIPNFKGKQLPSWWDQASTPQRTHSPLALTHAAGHTAPAAHHYSLTLTSTEPPGPAIPPSPPAHPSRKRRGHIRTRDLGQQHLFPLTMGNSTTTDPAKSDSLNVNGDMPTPPSPRPNGISTKSPILRNFTEAVQRGLPRPQMPQMPQMPNIQLPGSNIEVQ